MPIAIYSAEYVVLAYLDFFVHFDQVVQLRESFWVVPDAIGIKKRNQSQRR